MLFRNGYLYPCGLTRRAEHGRCCAENDDTVGGDDGGGCFRRNA